MLRILAGGAVVVAVLISGCGGGGSPAQATTGSSTSSGSSSGSGSGSSGSSSSSGSSTSTTTALPKGYASIQTDALLFGQVPYLDRWRLQAKRYLGNDFAANAFISVLTSGEREMTADSFTVRTFATSDGVPLSWASHDGTAALGIGVEADDAMASDEFNGKTYTLLGNRCSTAGVCRATYATMAVDPAGRVQICVEGDVSGSCPNKDTDRYIAALYNDTGFGANAAQLMYSNDAVIGSRTRGTIAFRYSDYRYVNNVRTDTDTYVFFGHRDDVSQTSVASMPTMVGYRPDGSLATEVPAASTWAVSAHPTVPRLMLNVNGDMYLRSTTGQLVTWSTSEGLRIYSKQ